MIGGGIAGPACALALRRAGHDAVVVDERPEHIADEGLFLNVAPNGLRALEIIGVELTASVGAIPVSTLEFRNHRGRLLGRIRAGSRDRDAVCIDRAQLHRALRRALGHAGVEFVSGTHVTSVRERSDGVVLEGDSAPPGPFDLVVGADGIRSRLRGRIDPDAATPGFVGHLSVGGTTERAAVGLPRVQHFVFTRRAMFGHVVDDAGDVRWFCNIEGAPADVCRARGTWRRALGELLQDAPDALRELVERSGPISAHPVHDVSRCRTWSRGRTVLIGDALHATAPNAGQGASLAIEDAVELARCLRDLDAPSALHRFERLRRDRVEQVVRYSRRRARGAVAGPVGRAVRDLVMPTVLRRIDREDGHAWMHDHTIDWEASAA